MADWEKTVSEQAAASGESSCEHIRPVVVLTGKIWLDGVRRLTGVLEPGLVAN